MTDLTSEFDRNKNTLPLAAAGLIQDVWQVLISPKTLHHFRGLSTNEHEEKCIEVLQHCLSSFDDEKWRPLGQVQHVAWETLVDILGRALNQSDTKKHEYVDRITNWNADEKRFAQNYANLTYQATMAEWQSHIERNQKNT